MNNLANINPEMLKWAREDAGYTLESLPNYLGKVEEWENGKSKPTWPQLRRLAKKYNRPSYFYFLSNPPKDSEDFIEFRSDEKIEELSPELKLQIRKSKFRRTATIKIMADMGIEIPNFKKNVSKERDYKKLAKFIREFLKLSFKEQKDWIFNENEKKDYSHNSFLYKWKELFFDLGILVFEMENVSEDEISGCSLYFDEMPIILLNGKNNPNRRIFTLMHELVHLIQGNSTLCDVDKHNVKEAFCNKVAAAILMPKETFKKIKLFNNSNKLDLGRVSHLFGVSKQTLVYRIYSLNLISDDLKNIEIKRIEENNLKYKMNSLNKNKDNKIFISAADKKKKYEGIPYTRLVIEAFKNNIITSVQFMKYLDISMEKFDSIDSINGM